MWLINTRTLKLEEFFDAAVPDYAILSHTWGSDEVSFQEFNSLNATSGDPADLIIKDRAGYPKIIKACGKALEYRLRYVWVDTCCIDKTSSAELSESINSMFRWYENAQICFAYLSDVPATQDATDPAFVNSRWFTRGWTLQELLAPRELLFFASDWTLIASREDTAASVSNITGIDQTYLESSISEQNTRLRLLTEASIAERMSWAARRTTTRVEDIAYCLLGIFGVNMPLMYGEGQKAFFRLQEQILQTCFDSTLLAWNPTDEHGQPLAFDELEPGSSWASAVKMVMGMGHPWSAPEQPHSNALPMGLLAPSPGCFLLCNDIVECETVLDWTPTSRGLEIELPVSDNTWPYAIIPCRLRNDPWSLLALPLDVHDGGAYSRSPLSAMRISHHTWNQWPRRRILLKTKIRPSYDTEPVPSWYVWINSLPPEMEILERYSDSKHHAADTLLPVFSERETQTISSSRYGIAGMKLESKASNERFSLAIKVTKTSAYTDLGSWIWPRRWPWRSNSDLYHLEYCIAKHISPDKLISSWKRTGSLRFTRWSLELKDSCLQFEVTKRKLLEIPVFEINIRQSPKGYISQLHYCMGRCLWLLQLITNHLLAISMTMVSLVFPVSVIKAVLWCKHLVPWHLSLLPITLHMTILAGLAGGLGGILGVVMSQCICNSQCRLEGFLNSLRFLAAFLVHLSAWDALMAVYAFHLLPVISCFAPRWSGFIRKGRSVLAILMGLFMGPLIFWSPLNPRRDFPQTLALLPLYIQTALSISDDMLYRRKLFHLHPVAVACCGLYMVFVDSMNFAIETNCKPLLVEMGIFLEATSATGSLNETQEKYVGHLAAFLGIFFRVYFHVWRHLLAESVLVVVDASSLVSADEL
ncbi:het domain-containing protein [Colletotrichum asianum]|uniref:Het domain-containing protein n=1 Tax=Colletotrichum asianum TaxID=702518 RepID=A0A8H3W947_9PEZI|nr:het domain-containing protein [Colletotrichum asianum]